MLPLLWNPRALHDNTRSKWWHFSTTALPFYPLDFYIKKRSTVLHAGVGMLGQLPRQFQKRNSPYFSITVNIAYLFTFLEKILRGGHLVLIGRSTDRAIEKDRIIEVQINVYWPHVQLTSIVQHQLRNKTSTRTITTHYRQPRPLLQLLLSQLPSYGQLVMQREILDHRRLRKMIIDCYIAPLLTTSPYLVLRPFHLDLAALPREYQHDTRHAKFERVVTLHLHPQNFSLPRNETHLYLFSRCVIVLFYHVGV